MFQTGKVFYGVDSPGWNLHTATGERRFRSPDIAFGPPFGTPPKVALALAGVDAEHATNLRLMLDAEDVEPGEFNIVVSTWEDSLVYNVLVTWIASD